MQMDIILMKLSRVVHFPCATTYCKCQVYNAELRVSALNKVVGVN